MNIQGKEVLWHVCEILQSELNLTVEGQVMLYNQKRNIPSTFNLWIVVGFLTMKPYAVKCEIVNGIEVQSANIAGTVSIDIFSRDTSALERKEEIILALRSQFSQRMQEKFGFKIGSLPLSFVNLSEIEGTAIPYRFNTSFQVLYFVEKQKTVDYYDKFSDQITVEG